MPKAPDRYGKNALLGVILCGGASKRMGVDKATLSYSGRALWQQAAQALAPQVTQLAISIAPSQQPDVFAPLPCIVDTLVDAGPLAGIASAAASSLGRDYQWLVFTSCDTPLQPRDWVEQLMSACGGNPGIYYICHQGQHHYLHALWHRSLLAPLEDFLHSGGRALKAFYAQVNAQSVHYSVPNLPSDSYQPDPFLNLNTPEDFARLNHD
ncbi:MAG TPA: molybdenum cofactor guanylyltransferase [Cellvibrionaceae bacterium]